MRKIIQITLFYSRIPIGTTFDKIIKSTRESVSLVRDKVNSTENEWKKFKPKIC